MKNKWVRIILAVLGAILVYAIISVIGLNVMINSSLKSQQSAYSRQPFNAAAGSDRNKMITEQAGNGADILQIFNTDGSLDEDRYNGHNIETTTNYIYYVADKYIGPVRDGRIISRADIVYDNTNKVPRVVFIYGTPAVNDDIVTAEVFAIKSPLLFSRTLRQFIILLTVTYVIILMAVIFTLAMRNRYEKARRQYIDNVTHTLKTPVTSIKALAESLYDNVDNISPEQKEDLQLILQQAELQSEMVNNILRLSNIQTYGAYQRKITVKPEELFGDPIKSHLPACGQKNISLTVTDNVRNLPDLYTDPEVVRQIIDVILDNSIKFTPDGGSIVIDAVRERGRAIIEIRDTGIGIAPQSLKKIFDRFYTTSIGNADGNGLGLAIAKELSRSLRESIWAESTLGKGTSVYFSIKLK